MKIIFMGSGDFGILTLKALINDTEHEVVGVFTSSPKSKDRGMKISPTPIHQIAIEHQIPTFTPISLKKESHLVEGIDADIIVVVAYGLILPKSVLYAKKYGAINLHPSKLPHLRGAAPLERAIIQGDKDIVICTMQMDEGLDTGDILLYKPLAIQNMYLQELQEKASEIGAKLILETINNINNIKPIKQSEQNVSYAHKLTKQEGQINWHTNTAVEIANMVRGMTPWPGVYFTYNNINIKLLKVDVIDVEHQHEPGQILKNFTIAAKSGIIAPVTLQLPGKKPISIKDFLNANPLLNK